MSGFRIWLRGDGICAMCRGSGYEPSVIISFKTRCGACDGTGTLIGGRPPQVMSLEQFNQINRIQKEPSQ